MNTFNPILRNASTDTVIWRNVFIQNEYHLRRFAPEDVVIDIGAHIGAFTCACLERGAFRIHSFEPAGGSFALLTENVRRWKAARAERDVEVALNNFAVWRSDLNEPVRITEPIPPVPGCPCHHAGQATLFRGPGTYEVQTVALDTILKPFASVTLLKLDCEGAEWPILLTSTQLRKVNRLFLEVHSLNWKRRELKRSTAEIFAPEFFSLGFDALTSRMRLDDLHCVRHTVRSWMPDSDFLVGYAEFERRAGLS